jgi:DSF synthase
MLPSVRPLPANTHKPASLSEAAKTVIPVPRGHGCVELEYDPGLRLMWARIRYEGRPVFSRTVLADMARSREAVRTWAASDPSLLRYVVLTSEHGPFGLGGDLEYFSQAIEDGDRAGLHRYAIDCVENCWDFQRGLGVPVLTIALVKGPALGGGLEAALSAHHVVAESGTDMWFPESAYGLMPGMGAHSFLRHRMSRRDAEALILGQVATSDDLYRMGAIDAVVPAGRGEDAVAEWVLGLERRHAFQPLLATKLAWSAIAPVTMDELSAVATLWTDAAMQVDPRRLQYMRRIVRLQERNAKE